MSIVRAAQKLTYSLAVSTANAYVFSAEMLGNRGVVRVLSHLPAANAEQEPNDIGLLLLLDLFDVLEGTHLDGEIEVSG